MLIQLFSTAVDGLKATTVLIEINVSNGADFSLVGLPDNAVRESAKRIQTAIANTGFHMPQRRVVINMAPANIRKEGTAYDLPLAIGMLAASQVISADNLKRYVFVGELGLDGSLRPVRGALPIAIKAREEGFESLILPADNAREAAVVNRLKVYGAHHITEVADFLNGRGTLQPTIVDTRKEFYSQQATFQSDFIDVKGQDNVKRALEIAAAGGHNIILVGSPGCGKSMMAKRLPSILPPLTLHESLETTQIHSVAGVLPPGTSLISRRPFRSPHHTISDVALIGGGTTFQPGEISLAHNGVLFLDELPHFSKNALETLRQPLEDRVITISRARYTIQLPCSFMLVASMNPCPCGYYNHPTHACTCTPGQIKQYLSRISGPLLDRIDLQIEVTPVPFKELAAAPQGESSATIRGRVVEARERQKARFQGIPGIYCNAQMTSKMLRAYAEPDQAGRQLLQAAMTRLDLSARAYERILKVARTIADLDHSDTIRAHHISEAVGYRNLDRGTWGE
ncbi:MAG: YifB family Mg chelatase-like AAA ATPase [Prevotellaceae bacterium]|nr:YifB family Mg chelatase-like AAA ATPase [Prevotellaceae bacterium]MDY3856221.1 YifB family Mg chelatase-like AAA ATPase [Bacteroidaceae bacterium]